MRLEGRGRVGLWTADGFVDVMVDCSRCFFSKLTINQNVEDRRLVM